MSVVTAAARFIRFSTLQRVEIAEMLVLCRDIYHCPRFSTLQRVEIAEIQDDLHRAVAALQFQYSSTSRNC